jgi:hydroxyacylglutathione hydrolase
MLKVEVFPLNELQTNAYLLIDGQEAMVIDPADEGGFLAQKILEKKLRLRFILATHGHFDHLLGLLELRLALPAPFLIHQGDLTIIKRHRATARHFLGRTVDPLPSPDGFLKDGQRFILGSTT